MLNLTSDGQAAAGASSNASMTADGRFVVFYSDADLLGDGTGPGIYYRDRVAGVTGYIDVGLSEIDYSGASPLRISEDGSRLVFLGLIGYSGNVCVYDFGQAISRCHELSPYGLVYPIIADKIVSVDPAGMVAAFNLKYMTTALPGTQGCVTGQVLLDLETGIPSCMPYTPVKGRDSCTPRMAPPTMSRGGTLQLYHVKNTCLRQLKNRSYANVYYLEDYLLFDTTNGSVDHIAGISADTFRPDRSESGSYLSADGTAIAYENYVTKGKEPGSVLINLTGLDNQKDKPIGQGFSPVLSGDGTVVAYRNGSQLIAYDTLSGQSEIIHSGSNDKVISLSQDGRYILFSTNSDSVTTEDTNGRPDVFLYDRFGAVN